MRFVLLPACLALIVMVAKESLDELLSCQLLLLLSCEEVRWKDHLAARDRAYPGTTL